MEIDYLPHFRERRHWRVYDSEIAEYTDYRYNDQETAERIVKRLNRASK